MEEKDIEETGRPNAMMIEKYLILNKYLHNLH